MREAEVAPQPQVDFGPKSALGSLAGGGAPLSLAPSSGVVFYPRGQERHLHRG